MLIKFYPVRSARALTLSVEGDTLTINGEGFDFSGIPEGATLPAEAITSEYIMGDVSRIDREINICVLFPITANASEAARFPEPITQSSGIVELPV